MAARQNPEKFQAKSGDRIWGRFAFPVTITQKSAIESIMYLLDDVELLEYKQRRLNGDVLVTYKGRTVLVKRSGRMYMEKHD